METMTTTTDESVDLYWEAIGSGPAVLLIAGTPGDGGRTLVAGLSFMALHAPPPTRMANSTRTTTRRCVTASTAA